MFVGTIQGKGCVSRQDFTNSTGLGVFSDTTLAQTTGTIATAASNVLKIAAPANGMAQFKGLTVDTTSQDYVQVICIGIAP